ncbi:MAG: DUF4339 domain-containing protein [Sedimentisphaerales bacterium]|nr:DUF4339 domain-containing protein [Sedimentisphaerales bacterium]
MAQENAQWYLSGPDNKPAGPYTPEQIATAVQTGKITPQSICWREGMDQWQPIQQTEPFGRMLKRPKAEPGLVRFHCPCGNLIVMGSKFAGKQAKCSACGQIVTVPAVSEPQPVRVKPRRWAGKLIGLALLAVLAAAGYFLLGADYLKLRQAEKQLEEENYRKAARLAEDLADSWFFEHQGRYLAALAEVYEHVSDRDAHQETCAEIIEEKGALADLGRDLQRACQAESGLKQRAQKDLALAADRIPSEVADRLPRLVGLALIRERLRLADKDSLAREIFEAWKRAGDAAGGLRDKALWTLLADWDPDLPAEAVAWRLEQNRLDSSDYSLVGSIRLQENFSGITDVEAFGGIALKRFQEDLRNLYLCSRDNPKLKGPLGDGLLGQAESFIRQQKYPQADGLIQIAEQFDEQKKPAAEKLRLRAWQAQLAENPLLVVQQLDRLKSRLDPANHAAAADLYWQAAKQLQADNPQAAQAAAESAIQLKPDLLTTETETARAIQFLPASEKKLILCQRFLQDYPNSDQRPAVLASVLQDATAVANAQSFRAPAYLAPYLQAGQEAAAQLLDQYASSQADLDTRIHEFARALAKQKDFQAALNLTSALLEAMPETPSKLIIEQDRAGWRLSVGRGTLPAELDQLAEQVDNNLKILTLNVPGALAALQDNPRAVHVVQVAKQCTADKFNSEQADMLRSWVNGGGVLWVNNDVQSLFDIKAQRAAGWNITTTPAVISDLCPILADCRQVVISGGSSYDLAHPKVIPLLKGGFYRTNENEFTQWSIVPYGKGWISDAKTVDINKFDGARFWLNFRLFCLGQAEKIPNAPAGSLQRMKDYAGRAAAPPVSDSSLPQPQGPAAAQPITPPAAAAAGNAPTVVNSLVELDQALQNADLWQVLWVRLAGRNTTPDQRRQLQFRVAQGAVLWLESDLVKSFRFPNIMTIPPAALQGEAVVVQAKHAILEGIGGTRVRYQLEPGQIGVRMLGRFDAPKGVTPLLMVELARDQYVAIAAVVSYQKGYVVLRPAQIQTDNQPGARFEKNLLDFSFKQIAGVTP